MASVRPLFWVVALGAVSGPLAAEQEDIPFRRPEAWAMAWFVAATEPTALGPPAIHDERLLAGAELGLIPRMSTRQRTVGFDGTKEEDLDRLPGYARVRAATSVAGFLIDARWIPPVKVDGLTTDLVSLAVARQVVHAGPLAFGARVFGQAGTTRGDLTGPSSVAGRPVGPGNPFAIQTPSNDTFTQYAGGGELAVGFSPEHGPSMYVGVAETFASLRFQVDDLYENVHDRTLLVTHGHFTTWTVGVEGHVAERVVAAGEMVWVPLSRQTDYGPREREDFLGARLFVGISLP
jgi:hypothetical protein